MTDQQLLICNYFNDQFILQVTFKQDYQFNGPEMEISALTLSCLC